METINVKLTKDDVNWLHQATKKEYAYYLKNYGNEKYNDFTNQIFKLYAKFHALKIKRLED